MTALTLQEKLKIGRERKFFSIIDDEGVIRNISFCLGTVGYF